MESHKMDWRLSISTLLSIGDRTPKVISDLTGILSSRSFLDWLEERNIEYRLTDKVSEMLSLDGDDAPAIIITALPDLPPFITRRRKQLTFTFDNIPLNGNALGSLRHYPKEQLVALLDVVYSQNPHTPVETDDIPEWLIKADRIKLDASIERLMDRVREILSLPVTMDTVLLLASCWGELIYLSYKADTVGYQALQSKVDDYSSSFFLNGGMEHVLIASTPYNPRSVDRILQNIETLKTEKFALICFDCMGIAEWHLLKDYLGHIISPSSEKSLFAMLPSVTAISRSAIFRGNRDVYELSSPGRAAESKSFADFFSTRHARYFTEQDEISDNSLLGYNAVAVLYSFFDDLCHSAQFPAGEDSKAIYFDAINAWLKRSSVAKDMETLFANGYQLFICSDHGSVVARGNGKKLEKYLIDNFAKRAVIIPASSADLIEYPKIDIPFIKNKRLVLPEGRSMFANINQIELNHGGITVEEMVVPYITLK